MMLISNALEVSVDVFWILNYVVVISLFDRLLSLSFIRLRYNYLVLERDRNFSNTYVFNWELAAFQHFTLGSGSVHFDLGFS